MAPSSLHALQLHGTGTSLGDPIEVGAIAALLSGKPEHNVQPLTLMAGKSWIGHSEPAAGVMGLAHAQMALALSASLPMLHLATVNPFIAAALQRQPLAMPRQVGGLAVASGVGTSGVSSFAFQGTNAHVLIQAPALPAGGTGGQRLSSWQRRSCWVTPPMFDLIATAGAGKQLAIFEANLHHASAAYLRGASHGRLTLGTALEIASEAALQLNSSMPGASGLLLTSLVVATRSITSARPSALQCSIKTKTGEFELLHTLASDTKPCGSGTIITSTNTSTSYDPSTTCSQRHLWLPGVTAPAQATTASLASGSDVSPATTAANPTAVDSSLLLLGPTAPSSIAAAIINHSLSSGAPLSVAATASGLILLCDSGTSELLGIAAAPSTKRLLQPATAAVSDASVDLTYSITWLADSASSTLPIAAGTSMQGGRQPCASDALALVQSAVAGGIKSITFLAKDTVQPVTTPGGTPGSDFAAAALGGLLKAVATEVPSLGLSIRSSDSAAAAWTASLSDKGGAADSQGMYTTAGALFVPRLLASKQHVTTLSHNLASNYIVTGGSGVLGSHVALWLTRQDVSSIVLISRSGDISLTVLEQLSSASVVTSLKADAGMRSDLAAISTGPSCGVMHAGGMLADATISSQTSAGLRQVIIISVSAGRLHSLLSKLFTVECLCAMLQVFAPKAVAGQNLMDFLAHSPHLHQVMFSSVAALLGSPGQANYSAANTILDVMASRLNQQVCMHALNSVAYKLQGSLFTLLHHCPLRRAGVRQACSGALGPGPAWPAAMHLLHLAWSAWGWA